MANGTMYFQINDLSVSWDEVPRRVEKPCVHCGKPTKGRAKGVGGLSKPAHMSCAMSTVTDKALKLYTVRK